MPDTSNTEATPSEAEIEAAAKAMGHDYLDEAHAALTAAYAIRLPPLLAELERLEAETTLAESQADNIAADLASACAELEHYREALERVVSEYEDGGMSGRMLTDIATQALQEQSE